MWVILSLRKNMPEYVLFYKVELCEPLYAGRRVKLPQR